MDIDVFPNSLEYWGPTGMVFFRNVQARWMPIQGTSRLTIAVERPGASNDAGLLADRIELEDVSGRSPLPDLTAEYRWGGSRGYVEAAGLLGRMEWDDLNDDAFDLSGSATRWGINLSSNVKFGDATTLRLQFVFGEGIQNYMNDAPVDVGIVRGPSPSVPIEGEAIPITASVLFLDHNWSDKWSTSIGYSRTDIDNLEGQADDAYKTGQYALGNLLYSPVRERHDRRRAAVGQAGDVPRSLRGRRLQAPVLVPLQLLGDDRRSVSHEQHAFASSGHRPGRDRPGRRRGLVRPRRRRRTRSRPRSRPPIPKYQGLKEGKNADYIPALAKVDPNLFGIALVTADGKVYTVGDVKTEVSIQSISKVFTMAQVVQEQGLDAISKTIGVDATGARFNSIIAIEGVRAMTGAGAPEMNPLVNPGAISSTGLVRGNSADEVWNKIIGFHNDAAGRQLTVLQDVYKSESDSNQRNQAIGALMLAYGYIKKQLAAGRRPLHPAVLDRRQRPRPGGDGRHAGDGRQQPGDQASR